MSTSPESDRGPRAGERIHDVEFSEHSMTVHLVDGRSVSVPMEWYPRLANATSAQRKNWEFAGGGYGLHWPDVDEDLSIEGILNGIPGKRRSSPAA